MNFLDGLIAAHAMPLKPALKALWGDSSGDVRIPGRTGMDYIIEGTASLVTREAVATAFEQAYGWQLTREDGTWHQLGDAVRTGKVQPYRFQPDKGFAFATGSESSQTRYQWS